MDFEYLEERIRNSYRFLTKRKMPDLEDDCVQECLLSYWKNGKGQTVDQAVIDFLRANIHGRKGTVNYETRKNIYFAGEIPESATTSLEEKETLDFSYITGRVRVILDLHKDGYLQKEIGQMLGITESRVNGIISRGL